MARIVYGIMGDSRGHLSRSMAVAQSMPEHEFLFVGGGAVLELREGGGRVHEAPMVHTILREGRVDGLATVRNGLRVIFGSSAVRRELERAVEVFDPALVISDYEYFTPRIARRLGLPCVSLDHQHVLTHCVYERPRLQRLNRFFTCLPVRGLYSSAERFFVSTFFQLPAKDPERVEVFPPVLRTDVPGIEPTRGEHGLVYVRGGSLEWVKSFLGGREREYHIYGFGQSRREGNLVFKPASRDGFLRDLAGCAYVVSNGGHSLLSESLYYGKPVLCFPTAMFYEQFLNGYFLDKLGLGEYSMDIGRAGSLLEPFEARLEERRARIREHDFHGNAVIAARLNQLLDTAA